MFFVKRKCISVSRTSTHRVLLSIILPSIVLDACSSTPQFRNKSLLYIGVKFNITVMCPEKAVEHSAFSSGPRSSAEVFNLPYNRCHVLAAIKQVRIEAKESSSSTKKIETTMYCAKQLALIPSVVRLTRNSAARLPAIYR